MRLDPVVWQFVTTANRDDILPLAFPITTKSGEHVGVAEVMDTSSTPEV